MTERMCIATRTVRPVDELIRFVAGPEGEVVPDVLCKLPGRGVWVTADRGLVEEAVRKNLFSRSMKCSVRASADLAELVGKLLRKRPLDLLSLVQKAGLVRCGFEKIIERAKAEPIVLLLHAAEASDVGRNKLAQRLRSVSDGDDIIPALRSFSSDELSLAFGRSNVIHAALTDGNLTDTFAAAARKFENFWNDGTGPSFQAPLNTVRMES